MPNKRLSNEHGSKVTTHKEIHESIKLSDTERMIDHIYHVYAAIKIPFT